METTVAATSLSAQLGPVALGILLFLSGMMALVIVMMYVANFVLFCVEDFKKNKIKGIIDRVKSASAQKEPFRVKGIDFHKPGYPTRLLLDLTFEESLNAAEKERLEHHLLDQIISERPQTPPIYLLKAQRAKMVRTTIKDYEHIPLLVQEIARHEGVESIEVEVSTEALEHRSPGLTAQAYVSLQAASDLTPQARWYLQEAVAQTVLQQDPTETLQKVYVKLV